MKFNPLDPLGEKTTINMEIRTTKLSPELIEFQTWQDDFLSNEMRKFSEQCMDLQDKAVEEALVALGWTPPFVSEGETECYLRQELKRVRGEKNEYLKLYNKMKEEMADLMNAVKKFVKDEEGVEC